MIVADYKVIMRQSIDDLERMVNLFIDNGWEPTGGVSEWQGSFMQAMIKKVY